MLYILILMPLPLMEECKLYIKKVLYNVKFNNSFLIPLNNIAFILYNCSIG